MKREHVVFFVLLVAAAMVMGSTVAIVSALTNYKVQQTKIPVNSQSNLEISTSEDENKIAQAENNTAESGESIYVSGNIPVSGNASSSKLTPIETREVKRMLKELGHSKPTFSQSLKSFQEENQLANTGILDSVTLDSMINRLSLNKARSFY
ncbi:MAG: peptidoglycan-binding protein [Syntrophomonadaceae bacterium]|nr:peptidoglycan-binding protein [Syntrophomonadaceae bacterium]